ncbi:MAG: S41 family peptidase [Thermoguttaceae bacterium]|nr:S41 family peptidase [Thermoguttaceae bacterium]MDW8038137.1 S41 family peptidase [Thermoguttaceae bacterium]
MPRRNVAWILAIGFVWLVSSLTSSREAQVVSYVLEEIEYRALEPTDRKTLLAGALEGMMEKLDPHSVYLPPKEFQEFEQELDQQFGGIGIHVLLDPKTQQLTVVTPLYGTPAYQVGIRAGDRILRIDGQTTQGMSLQAAAQRLRGKPGQPVQLTIQRPGLPEPLEMTIVRAIIQVDSVLGDRRDSEGRWQFWLAGYDRIGYIRIENFGQQTVQEFRRAMDTLTQQGLKGLILDLRNNPGGLLSAAIGVCEMFVKEGTIVTTRTRSGQIKKEYTANGLQVYTGFPIAVLVNQYSASASEIVAACLQDHRLAVVVGERTYGKGTVQEIIELEPALGALKLTTASYWRPSGQDINRSKNATEKDPWGVRPDPGYEVSLEEKERSRLVRWRQRRDALQVLQPNEKEADEFDPNDLQVDRQLMRAIQYIQQQLAKTPARPAAGK